MIRFVFFCFASFGKCYLHLFRFLNCRFALRIAMRRYLRRCSFFFFIFLVKSFGRFYFSISRLFIEGQLFEIFQLLKSICDWDFQFHVTHFFSEYSKFQIILFSIGNLSSFSDFRIRKLENNIFSGDKKQKLYRNAGFIKASNECDSRNVFKKNLCLCPHTINQVESFKWYASLKWYH